MCVSREFPYESPGERILKIGPHLPKLLPNIQGYTFFWDTVYIFQGRASAPSCPCLRAPMISITAVVTNDNVSDLTNGAN